MIMSHYNPGDVIFSQGDDANSLFIVKKGEVEVIKDGDFVAVMSDGSYFGESSLLEKSQAKRNATIAARTDVVCLSLGRDLLLSIFGQDVSSISLTNQARKTIAESSVMKGFTKT